MHNEYISALERMTQYSSGDNYMADGIEAFMPFIDEHIYLHNMPFFKAFLQKCAVKLSNQFISTGSLYCALRLMPFIPNDVEDIFEWNMNESGMISLNGKDDYVAFVEMKSANVVACSIGDKSNEDLCFKIKMTKNLNNTSQAERPIHDFVESVKKKYSNNEIIMTYVTDYDRFTSEKNIMYDVP